METAMDELTRVAVKAGATGALLGIAYPMYHLR